MRSLETVSCFKTVLRQFFVILVSVSVLLITVLVLRTDVLVLHLLTHLVQDSRQDMT